ncbi:MAG: hypothetical protein WC773_02260 [Patescibacteria group bacterium]|jgi:hypothetical protein
MVMKKRAFLVATATAISGSFAVIKTPHALAATKQNPVVLKAPRNNQVKRITNVRKYKQTLKHTHVFK